MPDGVSDALDTRSDLLAPVYDLSVTVVFRTSRSTAPNIHPPGVPDQIKIINELVPNRNAR